MLTSSVWDMCWPAFAQMSLASHQRDERSQPHSGRVERLPDPSGQVDRARGVAVQADRLDRVARTVSSGAFTSPAVASRNARATTVSTSESTAPGWPRGTSVPSRW